MNPFEKIFNYQIISRLEESGTIAITSHERTWLKTVLAHPEAKHAFSDETLTKLNGILEQVEPYDLTGSFVEKAKSQEKQIYHPLLRKFRGILVRKQGMHITYQNRNGKTHLEQRGFPYKLEYSMVKREWYLLWYLFRIKSFMSTRLQHVFSVREHPVSSQVAEETIAIIEASLEMRKEQAVIEVLPAYNQELTRILYAFSCFEKEVEYLDQADTYRIKLFYLEDDREYILSKIRFLGTRIRVIEGKKLQLRMYESAQKALMRYGISMHRPEQSE